MIAVVWQPQWLHLCNYLVFSVSPLSLCRRCVDAPSTPRHWTAGPSLWPPETLSNLEWKSGSLEKGSLCQSALRRGATWSWTSQWNSLKNWAKAREMHSSRSSRPDLIKVYPPKVSKQVNISSYTVSHTVFHPGRSRLRAGLVSAELDFLSFISVSFTKVLGTLKLTQQLTLCFVCTSSWGWEPCAVTSCHNVRFKEEKQIEGTIYSVYKDKPARFEWKQKPECCVI